MKLAIYFLALLFYTSGNTVTAQVKKTYSLYSPDNSTRMDIGINPSGNLQYRMLCSGNELISWSALGFEINGVHAGTGTAINGNSTSVHNETFAWTLGENDKIQNNYRELILNCRTSALLFNIIARVFNGSIAFRYELPASGLSSIKQERTAFNFTGPLTIYQYHQESVFSPVAVDTFNTGCDLPATLTDHQHIYVTVGEADNRNYTKSELKRGEFPHSLAIKFVRDTAVSISEHFMTPWRTVSFSKTAIGLHDYSELPLKLTPSTSREVPSWIKPGKLIRSQLNTQSGLECIDFASKHNFQYIMFDAGWYGAEVRSSSDPATVIPALDMPRIIQHGKDKGIGVILYVNYIGLRAKLDTLLPLYKTWGVKGLKFGFVDGISQAGISWLSSAIKKVNDYGFILNIHDNYKPTGLSRLYPALLTQEGIRGDENSPDAFHTTVLPFTRFLAGPADFTFCYPNEKNSYSKNLLVSKGQQLALTVIYFSPLQSVFWYGQPNDYTNEQEIEFFKLVPTVWNETHYLKGEIGKNISVARRKNNTWFVGNAAGLMDWNGNLQLDFLDKGKRYELTVYEDDEQQSIRRRILSVKKGDEFPFAIRAKGGQALVLRPVE